MLLGKVTLADDEAIQQQVTRKAIKLLHRGDPGVLLHQLRVTHSVSSIKEENRRLFTGYAAPVTTVIRCHKHPFICFWSPCTMLLLACAPASGCTGASAQPAVARISSLHHAGTCVFTTKPKSMGLSALILCIWFKDFTTQHARNVLW